MSHERRLEITPSVTVHALLEEYPDLEDVLIGIAPPFKKLKNPLLRRSVAKVATLKHISVVGGVALDDLIRQIQEAVGQPVGDESYADESYFGDQPDWFAADKVVLTVEESTVDTRDEEMTLVAILRESKNVEPGQIIELVTTFLPAPGIDILKEKGYSVWTCKDEREIIRTYFLKNT